MVEIWHVNAVWGIAMLSARGSLWPDFGATLRLALPLIASQIAGFSTNIVEVVLAGHLGPEVLGAVAVGNNVWMIPLMGVVGTMMAVPPSIAQLDGAGRRNEVAAMFRQGLYLAAWSGQSLVSTPRCILISRHFCAQWPVAGLRSGFRSRAMASPMARRARG